MLADLKARAAAVDRKRVYTAVAALLIAGAAGHFMQKTSGGATGPAVMSASVPVVSAPEILPLGSGADDPSGGQPDLIAAAPQTAGPVIVAATGDSAVDGGDRTTLADAAAAGGVAGDAAMTVSSETGPTLAETGTGLATDAAPEAAAAPELVSYAPLTAPRPAPRPATLPGAEVASTVPTPAPASEVIRAAEEVTRATTDPLLTLTEPALEQATDSVLAAATDAVEPLTVVAPAPAEPEVAGCPLDVSGTAEAGALLHIAVSAPCNSGEVVAFEHAGLHFSEQLGPDGSLVIEVPAMTRAARVSVEFQDGAARSLDVAIPDFDAYGRIAVVWQGATGLQLHALEGGAGYDEQGHVWADTPGTPADATNNTGGFLTVLGSAFGGYAADVYTYPSALMDAGQEPEVSIEAPVMENTCGGEIKGQILRTNATGAPLSEPLTISVPGCNAVGEFLVLKNLPVELKLARN